MVILDPSLFCIHFKKVVYLRLDGGRFRIVRGRVSRYNRGQVWDGYENRPQKHSVTPIVNLFLVGHWTKPGCGIVSVATSGWKLARHILKIKSTLMVKI